MRPVLKDPALQKTFDELGYVPLPKFLSQEEVEFLKKEYYNTLPERGGSMLSEETDFQSDSEITYDFTFIDRNWEYKQKVFDIITEKFLPHCEKYLDNYTPIIANFIYKKQDGGEVPLHQNWAFVDERKYTSISIWVPLVDSNVANGTLQMVDGSHKRFGELRGPLIPWEIDKIGEKLIAEQLTPMNVSAGDAVVLDDSIIHYSNVNTTDGLRLTIQLIMIPAEAQAIHYHLDRDNTDSEVQVLGVDRDFFMKFHPWLKPEGEFLGTRKFVQHYVDWDEYERRMAGPRIDEPQSVPEDLQLPSRESNKIFQDEEVQAKFETDGYVVMPWIGPEAVKELKDLYFELHPESPEPGFYSTSFSEDRAFKDKIYAVADRLFAEKVGATFKNFKKLGASFLRKVPGERGHMPTHQDWTVTDESRYLTATIWVPLQDVTVENGALKFLPGSHKFSNVLHGPKISDIYINVHEVLEPRMETLEMKAGEAVIFYHNVLHSSWLNNTDAPRIAVTYGLAPADTQLDFYFNHPGDPRDRLERIAMPDDFFLRYRNIGERPDFGESKGFVRQDLTPLTAEECRELLDGGAPVNRPIFEENARLAQVKSAPEFRVFKDAEKNKQLAKEGYVRFPFLDPKAVAALKEAYVANHPDSPKSFYASAHVRDLDFRAKMNDEIRRVFDGPLQEMLAEARALGGSFIAKPPGDQGILPPHADWNITDEKTYRSWNLWVPLVDTTVANGAVHILPYSHDWFDSYRGPGLPNPFDPVIDKIWDYMVPLEMKAGEALLYDHRLVHASPLNRTDSLRLACVYGIVPKAAEMRHYCLIEGKVASYRSGVELFLKGDPESGPGGLDFLGTEDHGFPQVSLEALHAFLKERAPELLSASARQEQSESSFFETYTPGNIAREISHRLKKVFG